MAVSHLETLTAAPLAVLQSTVRVCVPVEPHLLPAPLVHLPPSHLHPSMAPAPAQETSGSAAHVSMPPDEEHAPHGEVCHFAPHMGVPHSIDVEGLVPASHCDMGTVNTLGHVADIPGAPADAPDDGAPDDGACVQVGRPPLVSDWTTDVLWHEYEPWHSIAHFWPGAHSILTPWHANEVWHLTRHGLPGGHVILLLPVD